MDTTEILRAFATAEGMPVEAIRAARENRAALAPAFVREIDKYVAGEHAEAEALFFVFHLLGEWREKSAYRPLAALLRLPSEDVSVALSDGKTETSHRVMAAVFDGDPAPLQAIIRDPEADEYLRSRMCEALAMVTLRGEVPREATAAFLRDCFHELAPRDECFVWDGWQSAIAMLGLVDLVPLVRQAFEREFISTGWLSFKDFKADLDRAVAGKPASAPSRNREFELFGDTIEELSTWSFAEPKEPAKEEDEGDGQILWRPFEDGPAVNPYRNVGRNDPCPCGSGKKFKKCCLGKVEAEERERAAAPRSRTQADRGDAFADDRSIPPLTAYDPLVEPDAIQWNALKEDEQLRLVKEYHRRVGIDLPQADLHAIIHVAVESQIAELEEPTYRKLDALIEEGLDRHEAIHAIGSVLMMHLRDIARAEPGDEVPFGPYHAELETLTAESWRRDVG
jgi:hypothetical protein